MAEPETERERVVTVQDLLSAVDQLTAIFGEEIQRLHARLDVIEQRAKEKETHLRFVTYLCMATLTIVGAAALAYLIY